MKPKRTRTPALVGGNAGPDAYVTAHHLRDMLNEASLEQLLEWSREPGLLPRAGRSGAAVHGQTLMRNALQGFAADRDVDVRFSAQVELRRRGEVSCTTSEDNSRQATLF